MATYSKFDIHPGCEESVGFVPSQNDLVDSLPECELAARYNAPSVDFAGVFVDTLDTFTRSFYNVTEDVFV